MINHEKSKVTYLRQKKKSVKFYCNIKFLLYEQSILVNKQTRFPFVKEKCKSYNIFKD